MSEVKLEGKVRTEEGSIAERLFEMVRDRILYGDLPPGSKLTETALSKEYGVNRAPIREAFLRLEERRLIERVPFSGTRVFMPSPQMLKELFEIRQVLEGLACRRVAEGITPEQVDELMRIVDEREVVVRHLDDTELSARLTTLDFHQRVADLCGNVELQRILRSEVWIYLRANFRQWSLSATAARKSADVKRTHAIEHRDIVRAMGRNDGELAEILMKRHIARTQEFWESHLPNPPRKRRRRSTGNKTSKIGT